MLSDQDEDEEISSTGSEEFFDQVGDDDDVLPGFSSTRSRSASSSEEEEDPAAGACSRGFSASSSSSETTFTLEKAGTAAVRRSKVLVYVVIIVAALLLGKYTAVFIRNEEEDDFIKAFRDIANELVHLVQFEASNVYQVVDTLSITITSYAISTNALWPNITIPHFEIRGQKNNLLSKALQLSIVPLITKNNKKQWEEYSTRNQGWISESLNLANDFRIVDDGGLVTGARADGSNIMAYGGTSGIVPPSICERIWKFGDACNDDDDDNDSSSAVDTNQTESIMTESEYYNNVDDDGHDERHNNSNNIRIIEGPADYAPVWQQSPAPTNTSIINSDLLSHPTFARVYHGMYETSLPVMSEVTDLAFLYEGAVIDERDHPHSFLLQPLYPTFTSPAGESSTSSSRRGDKMVGFLVAVIPWDAFLMNLLAEHVRGIVVVLHDTCGDIFTYRINGPDAIYVGEGDWHDTSYINDVIRADFAPFIEHNFSSKHEHCEYDISIYPSKELEQTFYTHRPLFYGLAVILVFVITAMVFLLYDLFVERRQKKVIATAKRTNAIVSSLFPSNVRERILRVTDEQNSSRGSGIGGRRRRRRRKRGMHLRHSHHHHNNNSDSVDGWRSVGVVFNAPKVLLKIFLDAEDGKNARGDAGREGTMTKHNNVHDNLIIPRVANPIADFFPSATVMFADIVGFTAWSSVREPSQVFALLEAVFHSFDELARKRRVFKVETVGDCYVAVAGLPEPRHDHAMVMTRFAKECISRISDLVKKLEVKLGPGTGDLSIRVGLHSGPVTAGVLRGEKARFQLFGDTVNTTARVEATGLPNRIHVSKETAEELINSGKCHWVRERKGTVQAKGKGQMHTYWIDMKMWDNTSIPLATTSGGVQDENAISTIGTSTEVVADLEAGLNIDNSENEKQQQQQQHQLDGRSASVAEARIQRLINWNTECLARLLRHIIAHRGGSSSIVSGSRDGGQQGFATTNHHHHHHTTMTMGTRRSSPSPPPEDWNTTTMNSNSNNNKKKNTTTVIDEVVECIQLPAFDAVASKKRQDPATVDIDPIVMKQLNHYVSTISTMYLNNPFHNFEHASHVTMSVVKLLNRIAAPDIPIVPSSKMDDKRGSGGSAAGTSNGDLASTLHDHTYGITSDPLTQFACVFAALIHDVGHEGVPNPQLIKEGSSIARVYNGKSIAEQNSVDIAWRLLMDVQFTELRSVICRDSNEIRRFRQLVVNSVIATDIFDPGLKSLRNARWETAFDNSSSLLVPGDVLTASAAGSDYENVNRKATIVIEHLIQASDVAHTMQHWHIYRKWNERLFHEMYLAYKSNRSTTDPSIFWYQGELNFFDSYIIPLAKKLAECGVFGVSSDEYLNYANKNRQEWELRGQEVITSMLKNYNKE